MRERNTLIGGMLVGTAVLGISAPVTAAPVLAQATPSPTGPASHSMATPDTAGGLSRDQAGEKQLTDTINQMRAKIDSVASGKLKVVSAFYRSPQESAPASAPAGAPASAPASAPAGAAAGAPAGAPAGVIFVGGVGGAGSMGDPDSAMSGFKSGVGADQVTDVEAGPGGGKAACAQTSGSDTHAYCFWATTDSFGLIVPTYATTAAKASDIMRKMRPDLEPSAP